MSNPRIDSAEGSWFTQTATGGAPLVDLCQVEEIKKFLRSSFEANSAELSRHWVTQALHLAEQLAPDVPDLPPFEIVDDDGVEEPAVVHAPEKLT